MQHLHDNDDLNEDDDEHGDNENLATCAPDVKEVANRE